MEPKEKVEEILETLWIRTQEAKEDSVSRQDLKSFGDKVIQELVKAGYVALSDGQVSLTSVGLPMARDVVRRHRLAERLLTDVLDSPGTIVHDKACKFEHWLDQGLDESICTLLGHPKLCPHGRPIPPGRCCQQEQRLVSRLVLPLSQLKPGQKGKVAYIYAPALTELQKLMAMGILPGVSVSLVQKLPSYVFQTHHTQFAIDKEIADAIYVRLASQETPHPGDQTQQKRQGAVHRLLKRFASGH